MCRNKAHPVSIHFNFVDDITAPARSLVVGQQGAAWQADQRAVKAPRQQEPSAACRPCGEVAV